jgi:phage/conjugal plasmid C-4 type zinc finger TraR family protein
MADDADIASDYAHRLNEEQLEARVRFEGESETHCIDCDEEIPQLRCESLPGVQRCVDCQSLAERT